MKKIEQITERSSYEKMGLTTLYRPIFTKLTKLRSSKRPVPGPSFAEASADRQKCVVAINKDTQFISGVFFII